MPYPEKRGDGEFPWSVKYKLPRKPGEPQKYKRASGFGTYDDAMDYGLEQEADIRRNKWRDPSKGALTLDEYKVKWFAGYDTSSRNHLARGAEYRNHIGPRFGHVPLREIEATDVDEFDKELHARQSKKYADGIIELMRMMMDDALWSGLIDYSPVRAKRRRGKREPPAPPKGVAVDLATVLAICARLPGPEALMVLIGAFTGMRWGELIGMRRSFLTLHPATKGKAARGEYVIDPDIGAVHEEAGRRFFAWPKGRKGRTIELPPFLVEKLIAYLATFDVDRDLLFVNRENGMLDRSNFSDRLWRPACDGWPAQPTVKGHAAVEAAEAIAVGLRPHDLRHTHKTWLADDQIEPRARDERLGHVTPGMDGTYIHPTPAMRARILKRLQSRWDSHQNKSGD